MSSGGAQPWRGRVDGGNGDGKVGWQVRAGDVPTSDLLRSRELGRFWQVVDELVERDVER